VHKRRKFSQVSMSAPAIFPFVPKCMRMNFPCHCKHSISHMHYRHK